VCVVVIVLLLWFVFVRRGLPEAWRVARRGAARVIDLGVGAVLRVEYTITSARRRGGKVPSRWAFALAGVWETLEDCAARMYQGGRQGAEHDPEKQGSPASNAAASRPRKPSIPWRLCIAIVVFFTAVWITMNHLSPTSVARYRISQAFDPWRDVEEWAGVSSDRDTQPILVRVRRRRPLLVNAKLDCESAEGCHGWVLLKGRNEALVAVQYVDMGEGPLRVQFQLTPTQAGEVAVPDVVVANV
jgi:hypothetical protein